MKNKTLKALVVLIAFGLMVLSARKGSCMNDLSNTQDGQAAINTVNCNGDPKCVGGQVDGTASSSGQPGSSANGTGTASSASAGPNPMQKTQQGTSPENQNPKDFNPHSAAPPPASQVGNLQSINKTSSGSGKSGGYDAELAGAGAAAVIGFIAAALFMVPPIGVALVLVAAFIGFDALYRKENPPKDAA